MCNICVIVLKSYGSDFCEGVVFFKFDVLVAGAQSCHFVRKRFVMGYDHELEVHARLVHQPTQWILQTLNNIHNAQLAYKMTIK